MQFLSKTLLTVGRFSLLGFEFFVAFIFSFWITATILSRIGVPNEDPKERHTIIYITSNGVHTDVVVPIKNEIINWQEELNLPDSLIHDSIYTHLAIGWGDKGFFLETKDWGDLKLTVVLKAAFHLGSSAMHLVHREEPDVNDPQTIQLSLSSRQYKALVHFVKMSFSKKNDSYLPIKDHPYGDRHFFFEAKRSYGLTYTCNSWTNSALKSCGQRACMWTAFKDGIYLQYGK